MIELSAAQLFAAAMFLLTAMVWAIVAGEQWSFRLRVRPHNPTSRLLPWLCSCAAAFFALAVVFSLVPPAVHLRQPPALLALYHLADILIIVALALTRHLALTMPLEVGRPTRRWLVLHYGVAALVIFLTVDTPALIAPTETRRMFAMRAVHFGYIVVMLTLSVAHVARYARRGRWRAGSLGDLRTPDIVALTVGVIAAVVLFVTLMWIGDTTWSTPPWLVALNSIVGLVLAVPIAVRALGLLVRELSVMAVNLSAAFCLYLAVSALAVRYGSAPGSALYLAAACVPVLALVPLQPVLRRAVNDLVFRRRQRRQIELQAALLRLSPELGVIECCRRGMEEFARIMQLRGAGVLLEPDGTAIVAGDIDLRPLQRVWPLGPAAATLPSAVFAGGVFRELPQRLQDALVDAEIVGVTPIVSPRRRWGCGFITTGVLRASFTAEEIEAAQALAGQFALLLDAAELLERALSVERSLAHSEKLAAVGELAARVAHEIRNPVTAARSLAQLMVRDPASPHAAEHAGLILDELGRVERQVQALLRFARREEFSFEDAVDVGDVARSALEPLRARLEASGVAVTTDIAAGVLARADREKLRQVIANLLDNAVDAVGTSDDKRVALAVHGATGTAVLEVCDSGPGVPADALPRLFEPFFSLKTTGTGLGLAIVKRTVEAHGGRVEARAATGAGLLMRIELPVGAAMVVS